MHSAKLIWITPDAEALVGKIARVSNPNNEDNPDCASLDTSFDTSTESLWDGLNVRRNPLQTIAAQSCVT